MNNMPGHGSDARPLSPDPHRTSTPAAPQFMGDIARSMPRAVANRSLYVTAIAAALLLMTMLGIGLTRSGPEAVADAAHQDGGPPSHGDIPASPTPTEQAPPRRPMPDVCDDDNKGTTLCVQTTAAPDQDVDPVTDCADKVEETAVTSCTPGDDDSDSDDSDSDDSDDDGEVEPEEPASPGAPDDDDEMADCTADAAQSPGTCAPSDDPPATVVPEQDQDPIADCILAVVGTATTCAPREETTDPTTVPPAAECTEDEKSEDGGCPPPTTGGNKSPAGPGNPSDDGVVPTIAPDPVETVPCNNTDGESTVPCPPANADSDMTEG